MARIKFLASQTHSINQYKNIRTKVLKFCANIYFNESLKVNDKLSPSLREAIPLCISNLYNILCTVNTQHISRQDAIIAIRLYLATCFGLDRPTSGQLRTILRYNLLSYIYTRDAIGKKYLSTVMTTNEFHFVTNIYTVALV